MERLPKKYFGSISDYVKTYYTAWGVTNFADKAYTAIKTVTKDFTRTDPVFVRVGEDGEPEIHYTMTQANGTSYFANMDLGNATLYVHNGGILTSGVRFAYKLTARAIIVDSFNYSGYTSEEFAYANTSLIEIGGSFSKRNYFYSTFRNNPSLATLVVPSDWVSLTSNTDAVFAFDQNLPSIPAIDLSSVTHFGNWFLQCYAVTEFHAYGMKASFDLSYTALKHDAILEVFNNLGTVDKTAGITLTLGASKLALMSDAEKAIATKKGWTLA